MRLTTLLEEIQRAKGPVTGIELALRLGIAPGKVARMLDALRASGRLGIEIRDPEPMGDCSSAGSCSLSCPGPDECALTIDLNVTGLEIRGIG
ncbi:MAG: winged helix-turn-helix transcriptional regulator [bacterium]|nr:winged helix-turn-helix transcriptional regulator [bacterium]